MLGRFAFRPLSVSMARRTTAGLSSPDNRQTEATAHVACRVREAADRRRHAAEATAVLSSICCSARSTDRTERRAPYRIREDARACHRDT